MADKLLLKSVVRFRARVRHPLQNVVPEAEVVGKKRLLLLLSPGLVLVSPVLVLEVFFLLPLDPGDVEFHVPEKGIGPLVHALFFCLVANPCSEFLKKAHPTCAVSLSSRFLTSFLQSGASASVLHWVCTDFWARSF